MIAFSLAVLQIVLRYEHIFVAVIVCHAMVIILHQKSI